LEPVET
jgi:integrase/recombinase XerD